MTVGELIAKLQEVPHDSGLFFQVDDQLHGNLEFTVYGTKRSVIIKAESMWDKWRRCSIRSKAAPGGDGVR